MKHILNKKLRGPSEPEFIVLNEIAQAFTGLKQGYPEFSDNWDEAKPLQSIDQIKHFKHITSHKLEIHFI